MITRILLLLIVMMPGRVMGQEAGEQPIEYRFETFINNDEFLGELELTDEQKQQIKDVKFRLEEKMFEVAQQPGQTNQSARIAFTREFEQAFFNILLPFQQQRARQLVIWSTINLEGFGKTITSWPVITSRLEAAEEEQARVREIDEELLARYREEYEQLQQKYLDAFRVELTEEQRRQFEQDFGERSVIGTPPVRY
ncbi:MAG: hypothetical protein AAF456_10080 [Planctomycetota bacterium]